MKLRAEIWSGSRELRCDQLDAPLIETPHGKITIRAHLLSSHHAPGHYVVIHGACPGGLDAFVDAICLEHRLTCLRMPAPWDEMGRDAGSARNEEMMKVLRSLAVCGYACAVRCFPTNNSKGTRHMAHVADRERASLFVTEMGDCP